MNIKYLILNILLLDVCLGFEINVCVIRRKDMSRFIFNISLGWVLIKVILFHYKINSTTHGTKRSESLDKKYLVYDKHAIDNSVNCCRAKDD